MKRERRCADCGTDISDRGGRSTRCVACQAERRRQLESTGSLKTAEVVAAWVGGESMASIARRAGVSRQRIGQRVQESGAQRPKRSTKAPAPKRQHVPNYTDLNFTFNEKTGHWWAYSPHSKRTVRAAQAIAQRRLGRPLRRYKEYAVLLDGNPNNLAEDNVAVMSPVEAKAHRDRSTE